jgi:SpoIID/LytB domain protein
VSLRRLLSPCFAVVLAAVSLVLIPAPPAGADDHLAPEFIIVEGRGWGHGRGLSQWGSLGYAVDHGWTSAQILDHYYGGTTAGSVEPTDISVHLTAKDLEPLLVTSASAFTVEGIPFDAGKIARLEVRGVDQFAVMETGGCADPGVELAAGLPGTPGQNGHTFALVVPSAPDVSVDDVNQMLISIRCDDEVPTTEIERRAYRGSLGLVEIGGLGYSFNRLPIEQYLRGVVPRESPAWWGGVGEGRGIAALESQAVAARSYALALAANRLGRGFFTDACDTTACQVYGGAWLNGLPLDHGEIYVDSNAAIVNTAGSVRLRGDDSVAFTEFASSTGGWTAPLSEGSGYPAIEDLGDAISLNPVHEWTTTIARADIEAMFPSIGNLVRIDVTKRNGLGQWGGRTRQLTFVGTSGQHQLDLANWGGDTFRRAFGLRSDWYRFPDFAPHGFWVGKADGGVLALGTAGYFGDAKGLVGATPIVDLAATPSGQGYWIVSGGGDVFAFGDAVAVGSMTGAALNAPVVGVAGHPDGAGYWLAASDGGIFAFGSAAFHGSMGHVQLNQPVVGIETTMSGDGYWLVAADGGVFAFGDAAFHGSTGDIRLNEPITSMTASPDGDGYWFVAQDGGVFSFGAVEFHGSRGDRSNRRPIAGMAVTRSGQGYWLIMDDGTSYPFGDAPDFVSSVAGRTVVAIEVAP